MIVASCPCWTLPSPGPIPALAFYSQHIYPEQIWGFVLLLIICLGYSIIILKILIYLTLPTNYLKNNYQMLLEICKHNIFIWSIWLMSHALCVCSGSLFSSFQILSVRYIIYRPSDLRILINWHFWLYYWCCCIVGCYCLLTIAYIL